MSRACCNQNCDQGRTCPNRKPIEATSGSVWLHRLLLAAAVILALLPLAGCQKAEVVMARAKPAPIFTDQETGCEYYASWEEYSDGFRTLPRTPRLGRDGKQICREASR